MASLYAFLNPTQPEDTKEVIISDRFKDENGEVVPFIIKTISQDLNNQLNKKATSSRMVRGQKVEYFDAAVYTNSLIVESCVQPDFRNSELCSRYGTLDALEVPGKMLLPGEFAKLSEAIMRLNGFDMDAVPDLEEDAKNY